MKKLALRHTLFCMHQGINPIQEAILPHIWHRISGCKALLYGTGSGINKRGDLREHVYSHMVSGSYQITEEIK